MTRKLIFVLTPLCLTACMTQPPAPTVDRPSNTQTKAVAVAPVVTTVSAPLAGTTSGGPGYYTVKKGDSLYRIALENGQDYRDIAAWNSLENPSRIKEGQVLRVAPPGGAEVMAGGRPVTAAPVVEMRPLESKTSASTASTVTTPAATVASDLLKREPRVGKEPYSEEAYQRLNRGEGGARLAEPKPEIKAESKSDPKPEGKTDIALPTGPDEIAWAMPANGKVLTGFSDSGNKGIDIAGKLGDPVHAAGDGKVVYAGSGLRGYGELVIVKHNASYLSAYGHNSKILVKEGQAVTRGQKIAEMGKSDADAVKLHFEIRKLGKPVDPQPFLVKK